MFGIAPLGAFAIGQLPTVPVPPIVSQVGPRLPLYTQATTVPPIFDANYWNGVNAPALTSAVIPTPSPPVNTYIAEDGVTAYTAEDGISPYVQEIGT